MKISLSGDRTGRRLIIFIFFFCVIPGLSWSSSLTTSSNTDDKRVNFQFHEQSMASVANEISKQLNYKVFMDNDLAKMQITGRFNNVTLDDFFSRNLFRGMNIAIIFNSDKREVTINSLGKKGPMTEYNQTRPQIKNRQTEADLRSIEVTPGVKRQDIKPFKTVTDPMELEVTPGIKRWQLEPYVDETDPKELEVTPGVKRWQTEPYVNDTDPNELEVTPGIKRWQIEPYINDTDPMELEVTPGIKRKEMYSIETQ